MRFLWKRRRDLCFRDPEGGFLREVFRQEFGSWKLHWSSRRVIAQRSRETDPREVAHSGAEHESVNIAMYWNRHCPIFRCVKKGINIYRSQHILAIWLLSTGNTVSIHHSITNKLPTISPRFWMVLINVLINMATSSLSSLVHVIGGLDVGLQTAGNLAAGPGPGFLRKADETNPWCVSNVPAIASRFWKSLGKT